MAPDLHALTGAYAADALEDHEREEFETHLVECAECREEVRTLRETVAVLASALAEPPPPGMKARVLAEVAGTGQSPAEPGPSRSATGRRARPRWYPAAAAAAVVVAGLGTGTFGLVQAQRAEQQLAQARAQTAAIASVLAAPGARTTRGPMTGGGTVSLVIADRRAVVVTADVGALPSDRAYQLWREREHTVSSAGLGPAGPAAAGSWSRVMDDVRPGDQVMISVEPAGGSRLPTSGPVSVLQA